jgi:hypothetical protein
MVFAASEAEEEGSPNGRASGVDPIIALRAE